MTLESHPLFARFQQAAQEFDAPLGFACRGCGNLCCVNQEIYLTPPEAARIAWYLARRPELEAHLQRHHIRWLEVFIGATTGMPGARLAFLPVDAQHPDRGNYCPFTMPVIQEQRDGSHKAVMYWCGIHSSRPGACRLFPVGVMSSGGDHPEQRKYIVVARCPGFEAATPGTPVPPGYTPPDPAQTIADWIRAQEDPAQEIERRRYLYEVLPAFLEAGLHAPTEDQPAGLLSDDEALHLGAALLYSPPEPPADPADDHAVIMAWLEQMRVGTQ